jgi:TetR/AcrR family transcriptional regulator, mexJK operon transcriptional repressor
MGAISSRLPKGRRRGRQVARPLAEDPRVVRSRAAVVEAATGLFLQKGYAATTMEEIAALAGISKRTVYNNYRDKERLFREIVTDFIAYAEAFARDLGAEFEGITAADLPAALHDLGRRLAVAILRPEVIALRRILIRDAQAFPDLAKEYFHRAPDRVMVALASAFRQMNRAGSLRAPDPRRAAEQFAYLVAGAPLDRAMLVGKAPAREYVVSCAREGVETFLARYGTRPSVIGFPGRQPRRGG